jgi:hypothetical protein
MILWEFVMTTNPLTFFNPSDWAPCTSTCFGRTNPILTHLFLNSPLGHEPTLEIMNPHLQCNTRQVQAWIPTIRILLIKVEDHPMMTLVIFMGKTQMTVLLLVVVTGLQMIQIIQIMVIERRRRWWWWPSRWTSEPSKSDKPYKPHRP